MRLLENNFIIQNNFLRILNNMSADMEHMIAQVQQGHEYSNSRSGVNVH